MVQHAYNPSIWEVETRTGIKITFGCLTCLKQAELGKRESRHRREGGGQEEKENVITQDLYATTSRVRIPKVLF